MSLNTAKAVEVPLSLFGGLVTEMAPVDLPEGVSPACQDVVYTPGKVGSRPGLQRVFSTPFPGAVNLRYAKSYVQPDGSIKNLYLTSDGKLYVEDLTNSPGIYVLLLQSTPGSYAKSTTAFGREYIAISNGLNGADVPLQFDGTFLDRVTQDGPGVSPTVASVPLPSVQMAVTGPAPTFPVAEVDPSGFAGGHYTGVNIFVTGNVAGYVFPGSSVTVSGNSTAILNTTYSITAVYPGSTSLIQANIFIPAGTPFGLGGLLTIGSGITLQRNNNIVTAATAVPHNLLVGYQAQITGVPAAIVGTSIASIVINNEDSPGVATITTTTPHGLVPDTFVSIQGVPAHMGVGLSVVSTTYTAGIATVVTGSPHDLSPGATITTEGMAAGYNTTTQVLNVMSPTTFTYALVDATGVLAPSSGGSVDLNWPIPDSAAPSYFEVLSAPTATTFQVALNYSDATFAGGTVTYAWDGTFYVTAVLSPTLFQYQQYGPNANALTVGTVTPYGQAAPGIHQVQVLFLTRQGFVTEPSPPTSFVANGGQYLSVTNIPIGPSNVIARILAFTGSGGSYFFYIPVPAEIQGQIVSTATQINDNTSTTALLDFADPTLFRSIGISTPGNTPANQIVLDGALGFGFFASRLITWGQRNRLQNMLNLGFDGGFLAGAPTLPTGWDTSLAKNAQLVDGRFGQAWQVTTPDETDGYGKLSQSFYEDAYGAPVGTPNTLYKVRFWANNPNNSAVASVWFVLSSVSTGFTAYAVVVSNHIAVDGSWIEATFSAKTPLVIPSDLIITLYVVGPIGSVLTIDEISFIYAQTPYINTLAFGSYVNNPEAFDGVSGKFGPTDDTRKLLDFAIIRNNLYFGTQEPSGRWHETSDNGTTEPAGWSVNQVGSMDGLLSPFALTKSQADDNTGSGGEEWFAWASSSGLRIFGGDQPWKISQEIQPDWDSINALSYGTVWTLNDPVARVIYVGLPVNGATTPNKIYTMNYRGLDTPYQISNSPPWRTSFSGRLLATDATRKWAPWSLAINGGVSMYRAPNQLSTVLLTGMSFGNLYTLNESYLADDDYGQIPWLYTTFFFTNHEAEIALQLGAHRKMIAYLTSLISGVGKVSIVVLCNSLTNPWTITGLRTLSTNPTFDLNWGGASATSERMAIQFSGVPVEPSIDSSFQLEKLVVAMRPNARVPVRGAAQ